METRGLASTFLHPSQLEAGSLESLPGLGRRQKWTLGLACTHAQCYVVPGPAGKGREPRTAPPTSPTGLARAHRGLGLRPGWDGGSPSPRSGCAPGWRRVRPPPGLRPRARRPHARLPPRRSAPGSGDCATGAGNIRDLAPPPEAARLGGQRSSSALSAGRRGPRGGREGSAGDRGEGVPRGGRGAERGPPPPCAAWLLWGPCAQGTYASPVLGVTGVHFPACCETRACVC